MKRAPLLWVVCCLVAGAAPVNALPSLQLGPGTGSWSYDVVTGTWIGMGNPLDLDAYANATMADGGDGDYAWSTTGGTQIAYLVVSAVPKTTATEPPSIFDITVVNDSLTLSLYDSGNGAPPMSDPNDLAPHGIFDTYFEIYEFNFDGALGTIGNTQPGQIGSGQGYTETFDITINSFGAGTQALHFDLFTINGLGQLGTTDQVQAFAPFTHDAQTVVETVVPEPGTALLLGLGLSLLGVRARSR